MQIEGREISGRHPPYIVAEISCNHGGQFERAIELIDIAISCGADAVKFQAFTAGTITLDHHGDDFLIHDGPWKGRWLYDLYLKNETPYPWFPKLFKYARDHGITMFASVFDKGAVDMMERLQAPAYKIASFEINDLPLIRYAAQTGKPMIISTGMASPEEIDAAMKATLVQANNTAALHCVSAYPTPAGQANLRRFQEMRRLHPISGVSDHTVGIEVPIAAVALGACIIEKHLKTDYCSADAAFSLTKLQFKKLVDGARSVWSAMQSSAGDPEASSRQARRSLYVIKNVDAGERFTEKNVRSIRPGYGLPPDMIGEVLQRSAACPIDRGTALQLKHVSR